MSPTARIIAAFVVLAGCSEDEPSISDVSAGEGAQLGALPPATCGAGQGSPNECGGCGPITKFVGEPQEVGVSAVGAKIALGDRCSFPQPSTGYVGGKPQGRVNCLTATSLYCFVGTEKCSDGYDNDYDGLVDECQPGKPEDTKHGEVEPLQAMTWL